MTAQEFANRWNGKTLDQDGAYGGQCVDVTRKWEQDNGWPITVGNAIEWPKNYDRKTFDWIDYHAGWKPVEGDMVVFGKEYGPYGHIALVLSADQSKMHSFEQNDPIGSVCHYKDYSYTGVLGWLHPKTITPPLPPIGGQVTEKQWIDASIPTAIMYWKLFHPGNPNVDAIVLDLRGVYHGGDAAALYKRWMEGK